MNNMLNDMLPRFKNNKSGKIYTLLLITNEKSDREDFPETYIYFDKDCNWWSRPAKTFLEKNTRVS